MNPQETFSKTYAQCFVEAYPHLPAEKSKDLIAMTMAVALQNINSVLIDGIAFKATCKKLGIKNTYKAINAYLTGN